MLRPSKELLNELLLSGGSQPSSAASTGACSQGLSKYLGEYSKMAHSIVLDPQGRSLKTLEAIEKKEDVSMDSKILAQWGEGIDKLYETMKSRIEEGTKWGDITEMGVECGIRTDWFGVRNTKDSAQYSLQLWKDGSLQGCYRRRQEDDSFCEMFDVRMHDEGIVPGNGDVTDGGQPEACQPKLVRSLKGLEAYFYKQAEGYTAHLFPLLSKQLDIESQTVWKTDEKDSNYYSVETTSSTAIIISNAVTAKVGDEGWRLYNPSQKISPFCRLRLDESKDDPNGLQLELDQGFQLKNVVTPAKKIYDIELIREDIKAHFPSPAIKEDMNVDSTDSLCKAALFDYLIAVESYAKANGNIPVPGSSPTVNDVNLIETGSEPREYIVKKDTVLGKLFASFGEVCEAREKVPEYQDAWDSSTDPINKELEKINQRS